MTDLRAIKAKVLRLYMQHVEKQLLAYCESLARDGYTIEEIEEAIESTRQKFDEGAEQTLRQITIAAMLAEAGNG